MKKRNTILIIVLLLLITCAFAGISIAIFTFFGKGNTNNVIETGRVIFSYSDAEKKGNGIDIENALPIEDEVGKTLSASNEYFDFSVTASTTSTDLAYEIVVLKSDDSTLSENLVKIYLTELEGNNEIEVPLVKENVPTYNELNDTTNNLLNGKTVYYGSVKAGEVAYGKKFRLIMWIKKSDDITDAELEEIKTFKVRVNVAAIGNK